MRLYENDAFGLNYQFRNGIRDTARASGENSDGEVQGLDSGGAYFRLRSQAQTRESLARTLIVALLTFVSGLLGFLVQWLLPVQEVAGAKGIICSIIIFVALLLALVLGLLI